MKRTTAFIVGFVTVLTAGVALAQVGAFSAGPEETSINREVKVSHATDTTPPTEETKVVEVENQAKPEPVVEETKPEEPIEEKPKEETDTTPPVITIIEPVDGAVFHEKTITFRGETEPGAKVYAGEYLADVDADGHWKIVLILSKGDNTATFKASDAAGNVGKDSVTVVYEPPVAENEFTANQKYGHNAEGYEKFYGTGTPGSKVKAVSEYGAADTIVDENGEWWLKVWFEAPVGKTFPVTVSDDLGHHKVFEFTLVEAAPKEFWAAQKYGSGAGNPAYDVFYGEGVPGAEIHVVSQYGGGSSVIGDSGKWDLKIFFEGAPVGEAFGIVLETSDGHRIEFGFTRLEG